MSNVIKPKRGSTVPTSSNLENGEIGINTSNQSLYYGTGDGVQQIKAENVTGVVGIKHGGTGSSTRSGGLRALINGGRGFTGDINTLTNTGVYWIKLSDCTNGPTSSGYGTMEVISYEAILQRFTYYTGNIYYRTFANNQWYDWKQIPTAVAGIENGGTGASDAATARKNIGAMAAMAANPNAIDLGKNLSSSSNFGGYINFHFNGSTDNYTSRLIETQSGVIRDSGSFVTAGYLQSFGGILVSGRGFFVNSDVYGTSLPAAGTAGRVFFKKV